MVTFPSGQPVYIVRGRRRPSTTKIMTRLFICSIVWSLALAVTANAAGVTVAFPNLPAFDSPINIEDPGDGSDRLFVVERAGQVFVFDNNPGVTQRTQFINISSKITVAGECGLLGLAFHPNYAANRFFYLFYVNQSPFQSVVARFTANAGNPNLADPATEVPIITISQNSQFHKGGCIAFGPDGYLYISLGDDVTENNAQSLTTVKGKVLRIDVNNPSGGRQYGIPPTNPFAGNPFGYREEIWAFGFRNPWRFSFDSDQGDLWLGDVGQDTWEEVDRVLKGRNYGWPRMEARACYHPPSCDTLGLDLAMPVAEYNHSVGGGSASITGGRVYRGPTVPSLYGDYIFADYITGHIWRLDPNNNPSNEQVIIDTSLNIAAFGADADGELYFSTFEGPIYRFVETTTDVGSRVPDIGALRDVRPNPFSASTTLDLELATEARATLEVFDVRGRRVATLIDKMMPAGDHTVTWDGRDVDGRVQPSGVFFCRLTVNGSPAGTRRIVLLK